MGYGHLWFKINNMGYGHFWLKEAKWVTNISPIIFSWHLIQLYKATKQKQDLGFEINGERIIMLPYIDDFCIITTNKLKHQKLVDQIEENTISIGLKLKPSKCRSFSIQKGTPTIVNFNIGEHLVPSVQEAEQKFLGKLVFFKGKSSETYDYIKTELQTKLRNIQKLKIRDEFKIWIY